MSDKKSDDKKRGKVYIGSMIMRGKWAEIPDEIEHLLNYSADFPVSVEVQSAFHMWKQKHSSFQEFVKAAGGPVAAKTARSHLE